MKIYIITVVNLMLFATAAFAGVSVKGQTGSINVPSAFIEQGRANISIYNSYSFQNNMLGQGNKLKNDTVYGAFSYAPLKYLEVSIGSIASSSRVNALQSLNYSGDLSIGVKGSYEIIPQLSVGGLGEVMLYSKTDGIGYNGKAASYSISLLASYNMQQSTLSFPLIASLRIGYLWDNTQKLLSSDDNNLISPIGKYAMGIRGDNLTILALSLLFPLPEYYIEPALEIRSQFAGKYSSYALTNSSFNSATFGENPFYIAPGINFYTPVKGLMVNVAAELSVSKKIVLTQTTGNAVYISPQTLWLVGINYSPGGQ